MKLTPEQKAFTSTEKQSQLSNPELKGFAIMPEYDLRWSITSCHSDFAEVYGMTFDCTMLSVTSAGSGPHAGRGCILCDGDARTVNMS